MTSAPELVPYNTRTPVVIASATLAPSQAPVPTPTPFLYKIVQNDTLSGIAKRFGVSLEALLDANPGMIPQALAVGQTITIPPVSQAAGPEYLSTPVPANIGLNYCQPTGGGSACFIAVQNPYPEALEDITLKVSLVDENGRSLAEQETSLPLNALPAGRTLPAEVFFSGVTGPTSATVQLVTSIRLAPEDKRYLNTEIQNLMVSIAWNGLSANLGGSVLLPTTEKPAASIWLAAVAYDANERIVGYSRLEWSDIIQPGTSRAFNLTVYSLGPEIQRVEVLVEARP